MPTLRELADTIIGSTFYTELAGALFIVGVPTLIVLAIVIIRRIRTGKWTEDDE